MFFTRLIDGLEGAHFEQINVKCFLAVLVRNFGLQTDYSYMSRGESGMGEGLWAVGGGICAPASIYLQGISIKPFPGCENAAGKLRRKR